MPFAHPFVSVIKQCIMRCDVMRRGIYRQMSLHMIFLVSLIPITIHAYGSGENVYVHIYTATCIITCGWKTPQSKC